MVTPAGTARVEDQLGQVIFLTKLAEAVPAASIHRQAIRENQQQTLTFPLGYKGLFQWPPGDGSLFIYLKPMIKIQLLQESFQYFIIRMNIFYRMVNDHSFILL